MTGSVSLVVNPTAGERGAVPIARLVTATISDAGFQVIQILGRDQDEAVDLTKASLSADTAAVVAIGGDGSAHVATQAVAGTSVPLGIVPAGSGNDLAAALRLPTAPMAATSVILAAIRDETATTIDLGRVVGATPERWWLTVMCAGFDSAVAERVNQLRWPRGPRRYDVAVVAEAARLRSYPMTIELDQTTLQVQATLVAVGNTRQYGGGKLICPAADPTDGQFDVTVVRALSRATLLRLAPLLDTGAHVDRPEVTTYRAGRVRISLADDTPLRASADGESLAALPIQTECVPGALRVLTG